MITEKIFPYRWNLADGYPAKGVPHNNRKVFGTFLCGGGSSMGYKLAGFDHLGGVEIDARMAKVYRLNHNPQMLYNMDIRQFNKMENLPEILYNLDILDGSPPCTTFSMAGERENSWGKKKKFAEGQAEQTLDDLCLEYVKTINKLKPKVCVLENVSGIVKGNAIMYANSIVKELDRVGYRTQIFLLNAAFMGVPQKRERVFFIGCRKELPLEKLSLEFNCTPILFKEICEYNVKKNNLSNWAYELWRQRIPSDFDVYDINKRLTGKISGFTLKLIHGDAVAQTMIASGSEMLFDLPRGYTTNEMKLLSTFPMDYKISDAHGTAKFIMGMSVPPVMMAQIARQIYIQWLSKI